MHKNSMSRRSSTNPVRISTLDREEKSLTRNDSRRPQTLKPKVSISSAENSQIPRARLRTSSCDRTSTRGKTPLRHGTATPMTPGKSAGKHTAFSSIGNINRFHSALPVGRRSLSADRVSSLGAKGSKKDTRPLTDKTYQAYMLNKIDTYFNTNKLTLMLNSNGSIKPVTLKMFVEISAYLVKTVDIKSILTINNYVEELPKIAKKLHYPGVITKSWLKTANAMHSWPNVLRWICWLVEICEVREIAFENYNLDNLPFVGDERQANMYKKTFFSMLDFYNAWNDVKLEEEAAMVEKYLQELEDQHGVSEEELNIARSELEEEAAKFQAVEEEACKIDEEVECLHRKLMDLQNDEKKQLADIRAKEDYIKTIISDTEQKKADCNILCEQIRLQKVHHDELVSAIKQQPMSKTEKDKVLEECKKIQDYMQHFDEHLQDIEKEIFTMDINLASVNHNLTKVILTYNKEILMHLNGDMGIDLEELKMPETGILDPQIMEILQNKADLMNQFKELMQKQITEKEHTIELDSSQLEDLQEKMRILKDESSDVANEIKEKKSRINKIKTDFKNEEAKLKEQIKVLQNDIKELQNSIPDRQAITEELNETTDKLAAVQRRKAYIEESAKLFFDQFYEILGEHRSEIFNILLKLNK
ncbi:kinetochore protein Ndc80 [Nomia melanderi]|uniref:kinetochore protein Ndc80 n=1 Tax=Nomia melanderi TaxID=2448451 RepID=UPI001304151C|nr:kinetochore protein NDC80 homolog [Nomia melanderi]